MKKIILVLALCICGIASARAQTSGLNPPPPPVCSASNAGALYTETSTSPNTVWTCSYYNLQYQWVVNPMYGGLVYYPIVPTTCSGALPVFLAGYPTTTMYVCIQGVPTAVAGGGTNITSLTGDATATGPGAAQTTVTGINGAAIGASINVLSTNASKQVVGATYQNVVNLFGSGSCSGFLKSDGTCSTPSSIPTGTTNQLLYYAANGTTLTPLNLGTNLSITSGTLNAAGGVSQIVAGSNVTISPSSGIGAVTVNSSGSGNPSSTTYILSGSSVSNDDANALAPAVAITSWTCTTSVCTWTVANTTGLAANSWVLIPGCATPNASDQGIGYPGCGWTQVLASGLTSTTFETADVASTQSCTTSCGTYMDGDWLLGPQLQKQSNILNHGTVYWPTCDSTSGGYTLACMAANFAETYGSFPAGTPSAPVYFVITNFEDDGDASDIESDLQTIWADAHARNWIVVTATTWPRGPNAGANLAADEWLYGQTKSEANSASGQYTDSILDVAPLMSNGAYHVGNGGFNAQGLAYYVGRLNTLLGGNNIDPTPFQMNLYMGESGNMYFNYPNNLYGPNWNISPMGEFSGYALNVSGDPSYSQPLTVFDPTVGSRNIAWFGCNTDSGGECSMQFGSAQSTNNAINWGFNYEGNGSTSSYFTISPYGEPVALSMFMNGDISIGNTTDSTKMLGVGASNQLTIDSSGNMATSGTAQVDNLKVTAQAASSGENCLQIDASGNVTKTGTACSTATGSVTSVGLSLPSIFTVTGSPVTSSGTLTGNLAVQSANTIFAGPSSGSAAAPTFRALTAADMPSGVPTSLTTTGTSGAATLSNGTLNIPQYATVDASENAYVAFPGPSSPIPEDNYLSSENLFMGDGAGQNIGTASPLVLSAAGTSGSSTITTSSGVGIIQYMRVDGPGISPDTKITSISVPLTLSNAPTITYNNVPLTFSYSTTATASVGSFVLTVANASGIAVGMTITGTGLPPNSMVTSISGTSVTVTNAVTSSMTGEAIVASITAYSNITNGNVTIYPFMTNIPYQVGYSVSGTDIPAGTTISSVGSTTLTLDNPLTANVSGNINLYPGDTYGSIGEGVRALQSAVTGSGNVALGYQALENLVGNYSGTEDGNTVAVGSSAGQGQTGINCPFGKTYESVFLGHAAGAIGCGAVDTQEIGNHIYGFYGANQTLLIGGEIGVNTPNVYIIPNDVYGIGAYLFNPGLTGGAIAPGTYKVSNVMVYGNNSAVNDYNTSNIIVMGENSLDDTNDASPSTMTQNIVLGNSIANSCSSCSYNFIMGGARPGYNGQNTAESLTTGTDNLITGFAAGGSITTGSQSSIYGNEAAVFEQTNAIVALGYYSCHDATGSYDLCIGLDAGANITTGAQNTIISMSDLSGPSGAANGNLEIGWNVGVGENSSYNVYEGYNTGTRNTTLGRNSAYGFGEFLDSGAGTGTEEYDSFFGESSSCIGCTKAVSLGYEANIGGVDGAVQIGTGTNTTANTMQFQGWNFLNSSGSATFSALSVTGATATVNGQNICLVNGTNCPATLPSVSQPATNTFGGSCTMSTATTCTITLGHSYTTPVCIATVQGTTPLYAACSVSGTTVTITASASNSDTWGAMVFGNPN